MNIQKKIMVAAIPAVMALASTSVDSKILLMSQEGWEVSFDGAANAFVMHQSASTTADAATGGINAGGGEGAFGMTTFRDAGNVTNMAMDSTGVVTGLLPNVWGMTLKAPTNNGLDMQTRLAFYTHMQGTEDSLGTGLINNRETNFSVSGSFGTVLIGKSLGIHQSSAILNDMLLFGVGALPTADQNGTTLGRIGLGYLYADFHPQITWTTPGLGPIGFKVGLFDPNDVISSGSAADAEENVSPRVEAELTYGTSLGDLGINLWVDASYQNTEFSTAAKGVCRSGNSTTTAEHVNSKLCDDVDSAGVAFGTKLTYDMFSLVASGWYGSAMGMRGQHGDYGALDDAGKERNSYGGYIQGTADFGQGTSVGYSYGGNFMRQTGNDMSTTAIAEVNGQTMHSGMIWHNVNDSFRLIAEGGYVEQTFHMGGGIEDSFGGIGAFFFW